MSDEDSLATQKSALERQYIELLERKIDALQSSLDKEAPAKKPEIENPTAKENKKGNDPIQKTNGDEQSSAKDEKTASQDESSSSDQKRWIVVRNLYDDKSGEYKDEAAVEDAALKKDEKSKPKHAFTFRKLLRPRTVRGEELLRPVGSEVDIGSEPLQVLLSEITRKFTGYRKTTQLVSPFKHLIHSWDTAEEATKDNPKDTADKKQAREDLKDLLSIISSSSGDEALDKYFRNKAQMTENRTVAFETSWTLFPKGSFILARPFLSQNQVFCVHSCDIPDMDEREPKLKIVAFSYDWDGREFNRVGYRFVLDYFADRLPIIQLFCFPLTEYREGEKNVSSVDKLKGQLIARGKRYVECCFAPRGQQTFSYDALAIPQKNKKGTFFSNDYDSDDSDDDISSLYSTRKASAPAEASEGASMLKGVVVVDFKSYYAYSNQSAPTLGELQRCFLSECACEECRSDFEDISRYTWDRCKKDELTNDQLLMLPPRVLGYALASKQWVQLQVTEVTKPEKADQENFNTKLILDDKYKKLISNAVKAHGNGINIKDHIPGKGKGLVILLWGVPGVGKTFTAESVASLAGKPLFSIGVSDIGTESTRVEENLRKVFQLAGLWQAVLLFDEADVFLEARDSRGADMKRNAMVSVLLRILEYYEGILILTTNRLKIFDIAVQSRIHIAVEYADLQASDRQKIFMEFLSQLKKTQSLQGEEYKSCVDWVEEEGCNKTFNGRQIRNIVYTAMSLANAEKANLKRSHLVLVAQNTENFQRALASQEAIYKSLQINKNS